MGNKFNGILFVFAAITFWLAWFLMPDAGTNDARHILEMVRATRNSVWWSVLVQIVSAVAFVPAVVGFQTNLPAANSKLAKTGASLILIGAMGMCADAIFHLAAYYMTADGIEIQTVFEPTRLLQTDGIRFLVPLLIPFLIGGWIYASALRRASIISRTSEWIFAFAFFFVITGILAINLAGISRHIIILSFLGLIALGYASIGFEIIKRD